MRSPAARSAAVLLTAALLSGCGAPRWPVEAPMTSPFGLRTVGWKPGVHHGVDIGARGGTPVRAMTAGRVTFAGTKSGYGKAVIISHGLGWTTLYAHMSEIRVEEGDWVGPRKVVGMVGSTGRSTGAHLHFEVRHFGQPMDPVPLLGRFP